MVLLLHGRQYIAKLSTYLLMIADQGGMMTVMVELPDALHHESRTLLETFVRDGVRPYDELGVLRARAMVAGSTRLQGPRVDVASVTDILAPSDAGAVPVRVYDPLPDEPRPVLVYLHGGGFVTGSVAVADRACRSLAAASGWVVASVEYRLAPETAFPGPLLDCVGTVRWLMAHAEAIGGDARTTVIAGDSAGGALATACTAMLRDCGDVVPSGQILIYPTLGPIGHRTSESIRAYGALPSLTRGSIDWFWSQYLVTSEGDDPDPLAVPLRQHVLAGLPDATVVAAGCDLLRDEAIEYVARLSSAGVGTRLHVVDGAVHGFWWMDGVLSQAAALTGLLAEDLRERAEGRWQPSR